MTVRIIVMALLAVLIVIQLLAARWLKWEEKPKRPVWLGVWLLFGLTAGLFLVSFTNWFIEYFGQLTAEQFLINLQSPVKGTTKQLWQAFLAGPGLLTLLAALCLGLFLHLTKRKRLYIRRDQTADGERKKRQPRAGSAKWNWRRPIAAVLALIVLLSGGAYTVKMLHLRQVLAAYRDSSTYIEDHYVDIRDVKTSFPQTKRNLIHIYLESVENSYFDRSLGGHMEDNLMPELAKLSKEGVSFSHQEGMGGPYQTFGSAWSVAAMVNMSGGVPLKVGVKRNAYGLDGSFLPGLYNLADYLHDNGYEQTVMFGADADFGGLTAFFNTHGNVHIFDYKYAMQEKLIPEGYDVWWGFEDDKLYEFAKQEITRLAQTGKPFHFAIENADTHYPHGYLSEKAPTPYEDHYANVIAYSSSEVVKLVRWIQEQDFYANTTVVLTGDHLSMDTDFFQDFDPNYRRSTYNLFLNAPIQPVQTKHRQYAPLDFYPTIVAAMGIEIEGDRLGLGTNLFSERQTLIEEDGFELFESELGKHSYFFTEQIVKPKN
ncbi:MAG: LTA synthase family protein [Eubacteriales bacterium]|nr:LTA synthase family protein [Eubacteriales bacterium]